MMIPNRPDALGIFEDSKIAEVVDGFQKSRYAAAVNRLVERLLLRREAATGRGSRGKRRGKDQAQVRSNTLRMYLKALERWSYYSVGVWGKEIDPRQVTTDIAIAYAKWLRGEGPGPDVKGMTVRALGAEFAAMYDAISMATRSYGEANIQQIAEVLSPAVRDRLIYVSPDPRDAVDYSKLHSKLGTLLRSFRNIHRSPSSVQVRREEKQIWSKREQDPMTYTYTLVEQAPMQTNSVATHVGALSAIWSEMTVRTSQDEPPLAFNPWKSVYAAWAKRSRDERLGAKARGEIPVLTTPIVRAMFNACRGADIESRRDTLALTLVTKLGLRAEELTGLLRRDLLDVDGVPNLVILGKGDKVRRLPVADLSVRDAITLLTGCIEQELTGVETTEEGEIVPTYSARYAAALLTPDAPLVPSLIRWGCNQKSPSRTDANPEKDALEPLDVSGFRALLLRIAERSRVRETATGVVRPLSRCTDACKDFPCRHELRRVHPHAFRHYAATSAAVAGVPLEDIQAALGHSSLSTTRIYVEISAQKSAAFTAGVTRTLARDAPLSEQDLISMRTPSMNPLEEPSIMEADPQDMPKALAFDATGAMRPPDASKVVASPTWAYEGGETVRQYVPRKRGESWKAFSKLVKYEEGVALEALRLLEGSADRGAYYAALTQYWEIRAKHLWVTFYVGDVSRLPWWAGRQNTWPQSQMAPLLSQAQFCPEDTEQSQLLVGLRNLYDQLYAQRGPTSANALVMWLAEIIQVASTQFAKDMIEHKNTWIGFDEEAAFGDTTIVREHAVEPVLEWFETYAYAFRFTKGKSGKNRGNMALVAMEELPDWFWLPDPLLELGGDERRRMMEWISGLQDKRKSRVRYEMWIAQLASAVVRWGRDKRAFEQASGQTWSEGLTRGDGGRLTKRLGQMREEFSRKVPSVKRIPDFEKLAVMPEAQASSTLFEMLKAEGIDPAYPARSELGPAIGPSKAGALHPFDPGLLTFDMRGTIVHDEETKRYWYEKFGTDSECVVRRSLRALWEFRKDTLRSTNPNLYTRQFIADLSSMIPCPADMEKRMAERGWRAPQTVDEFVGGCKTLWLGLTDRMRLIQGGRATTDIPQADIEQFWEPELGDLESYIVAFTTGEPTVLPGPAGQDVLTRVREETRVSPELAPSIALAKKRRRKPEAQATSAEGLGMIGDRWMPVPLSDLAEAAKSSAKFVIIGTAVGSASFRPALLQSFFDLAREKKLTGLTVYWDPDKLMLHVRWEPSGALGYIGSPVADMKEGDLVYYIDVPGMRPNAPRWYDDRSWLPRWPGYPDVDPEDAQQSVVRALPWPQPGSPELLAACYHAGCMQAYSRWKRNSLRPGELPDDWAPGTLPSAYRGPSAHPVDFVFAAIRPA